MLEFLKSTPTSRLKDYLAIAISHLTVKKLFNIINTELNFALRKEKLSSFPYLLTVDTINTCQLKCPLCATGQGKHTRPQGKMDFKIFKKIIDEIGDYLLNVHLVWWGEPFLNQDILKYVNYAHKKNIGTFISTNFSFPFNQEKMAAIIKSGLDVLAVSLDGITPEIYNKYRIGGNFHQVVKNIRLLTSLKKELHSKRPYVEWQFLVNKYNEHQVPKLATFNKKLGADSIVLEQLLILFGQSNHNNTKLADWLPKNKKYRPKKDSLLSNKSDNLPMGKCWWLWRSLALSHDGGVSPCCYNNLAKEDFGNILKNNFRDIWNNKKYLSARALFRKKKKKVSLKTLCHSCPIARTNG